MAINDYLKKVAYTNQILEFKKAMQMIAADQGFTLADIQQRFSNPLIDNLFEDVFADS